MLALLWLAVLGLLFGAALGARALLDPQWAQRFVRLKPDEQGGGQAEFRATYGGVILALHVAALLLVLRYLLGGGYLVGVIASGAIFVVAAAWAGSAFGRFVSLLRDRGADTRFNRISIAVELAAAAAIGAPWAVWIFAG